MVSCVQSFGYFWSYGFGQAAEIFGLLVLFIGSSDFGHLAMYLVKYLMTIFCHLLGKIP